MNRIRIFFIFLSAVVIVFIVLFAIPTEASVVEDAKNQLKAGAIEAGYGEQARDPRLIVDTILMSFVGLLGSIVTGLFVYAGYLFLTSHGEQDKLQTARKTMQAAVIGLILVLMSASIAYFVGQRAIDVTGVGSPAGPQMYESP